MGAGGGGTAQRDLGCELWERCVPAEVCAFAAALGGEAPDSGSSRRGAHPSTRGGGGRCAVSAGSGRSGRCDSRGCDSRREGPRRGLNAAHVRGPRRGSAPRPPGARGDGGGVRLKSPPTRVPVWDWLEDARLPDP